MKAKIMHSFANMFIAILLFGCAAVQPAIAPGDVLSIGTGQLVYGIQQAVAMKPGTLLLSDPTGRYFLAAWPCNGAQAWAFITPTVEGWFENFSGNVAQVGTWQEVKGSLDALKWAPVMPGTLLSVLGEHAVAIISQTLLMPMLITPAMLDPMKFINPMVGA